MKYNIVCDTKTGLNNQHHIPLLNGQTASKRSKLELWTLYLDIFLFI